MNKRKAFTLVELLVVIAIVGILIAVTIPAINSVRATSRATVCRNNMRQLALGVNIYSERKNGKLPAQWRTDRPEKWHNFGWAVEILPFLEQDALKNRLALDETPFSATNQPIIATPVAVFECPATPQSPRLISPANPSISGKAAAKDYVAIHSVVGPDGIELLPGVWSALRSLTDDRPEGDFTNDNIMAPPGMADPERNTFDPQSRTMRSSFVQVSDGLSNTALLVEQSGKPDVYHYHQHMFGASSGEGAWATAENNTFLGEGPNKNNQTEPYSFHGAITVSMCDTSVHGLDESIDPAVLRALLSSSGGEIVSDLQWK